MASGNFATLNPLNTRGSSASSQITNGNLQYNGQATQDEVGCTINIGNDGVPKVYFEMYIINNHDTGWIGIYDTKQLTLKYEKAYGTTSYRALLVRSTQKVTGSTTSNYIGDGSDNNSRSGQTVGVAIDIPNGKIWFAINNAWGSDGGGSPTDSNVAFTDLTTTGSYDIVTHVGGASVGQPDWLFNFGADSTMQNRVSAGGYSDSNSVGDFRYQPPTGFLALSSKNINISDDIDPAQTDDDFPQKQFNTITYTGTNSAQSVTGLGFKPDLVWIKARNSSQHNALFDSSRGALKRLGSSRTNAEDTYSGFLSSFDTDGFSFAGADNTQNGSYNYVAWCWRAEGGVTSSNSNGSTTSYVQANTKAGFSIVTYSGSLTSSGTKTVGHGLSKAPEFIIRKGRNTERWAVSHIGCTSFNYMLELNNTNAEINKSGNGSMSAPTTTVFSNNYTDGYDVNGTNYIAYCWHSVEGMQKFGKFVGTGSATNSPFIYLGFRPKMIFIKRISTTGGWWVFDSARDTHNPVNKYVGWHSSGSESSGSNIDFTSVGFKLRTSDGDFNGNGSTIIYGAWADQSAKYSNAF